jgi:hypothetical protein
VFKQHSPSDCSKNGPNGLLGQLIAFILFRSWRHSPPKLAISDQELEKIAPSLIASGVGALSYWKIRQSNPVPQPLRDAYFRYAAQTINQERQIAEVSDMLEAAGIAAILIKGRATARFYPELGLRPTGDIDLLVSPHELARARALIHQHHFSVDLDHDEFVRFAEHSFEEIYARSQFIAIRDRNIRVLGIEDHLRHLCLHFLKHGGWRPLWLCDIAATLETLPSNFNWRRCLGNNSKRAQWIVCTIELACHLLGASLDVQLPENGSIDLPQWLARAILEQWNSPLPPTRPLFVEELKRHLWDPKQLLGELRTRWPNPIQATVDTNGPFNQLPRSPFQLLQYLSRANKLLRPS